MKHNGILTVMGTQRADVFKLIKFCLYQVGKRPLLVIRDFN